MAGRRADASLETMEHLLLQSPDLPIWTAEFEVTGQVHVDGTVYVSVQVQELHSGPGHAGQWTMSGVRSHITLFETTLGQLAPHLTHADAATSLALVCRQATRAWDRQLRDAEFLFQRCDRSSDGRDRGRPWRRCLALVPQCSMKQCLHGVARWVVTRFEMWLADGELTALTSPHLSVESCRGVGIRFRPMAAPMAAEPRDPE